MTEEHQREPHEHEPMDNVTSRDGDFLKTMLEVQNKALESGVIDTKTKFLMCIALSAARYHFDAVKHVAEKAREAGATDAEIIETLRVVGLNDGTLAYLAGQAAFGDIIP